MAATPTASSRTPPTLFVSDSTVPRHNPSNPLAPGNYYRLSQETGLARQHISRALRGRSGLSFEAAQRIAAAAGVTVGELQEHIESAIAMDAGEIVHKKNGKAGKKIKSKIAR